MSIVLVSPKSAIAFKIFNFPIRYYGIFLTCAIFIGIFSAYLIIKKKFSKTEADFFLDIIPWTIFSAIVGARLFYVIGDLNFYLNNLNEIIMINHGGLSIFGALVFGILSFYIISKIYKINFFKYADSAAVVLPLSQAIGRWGNFFNQEAYGKPTYGFVKLFIDIAHRKPYYNEFEYFHPAFLYESVLNFCVFLLLFFIFFKVKKLKSGSVFLLYLIFYSVIRFFIERIRIDSILNINNVPVVQVLCIVLFTVSLIALIIINKNKKAKN